MASKLKKQEVVDMSNDSNSFQNMFSSFLTSSQGIENHLTDTVVKLPTGIDLLDVITGGGIPCKFSVFVGLPGGGKSSLLASFIKAGQKKWGDKFIAIYADSEESMSQKRLKDLGCIFPVSIVNGITVEKLFKCVESVCAFKESNKELMDIPSIVVWDSIANTLTEDTMTTDEFNNTDGARRAGALAKYIPKYIDKLTRYNIALCAVNQYRVKISMGMAPNAADMRGMKQNQTLPGGEAVKYNAYQMFEITQGAPHKNDPYGYPMSPMTIEAIKNKDFKPKVPIILNFNHSKGFSNFWTNYEFLKTRKYIDTGARCKLKSYPTVSFFQKQCANIYKTDPAFREAFDSDLKKAFKEFEDECNSVDFDPDSDIIDTTPLVEQSGEESDE